MFERLFKYPRVLARRQEGPAAEARQRFLNHCSDQGMARATLLRNAQEVLVIADRIDVAAGRTITRQEIEGAADRWAIDQHKRRRVQEPRWSRALFIQTPLGFASYRFWRGPRSSPPLSQTRLRTLPLSWSTNAACPRSPSTISAGTSRGFCSGFRNRIVLSATFRWSTWTGSLLGKAKRVGPVCRSPAARKHCGPFSGTLGNEVGVPLALPPALMVRAFSKTKDCPSDPIGKTYSG